MSRLRELAQRYGTPLYVYDLDRIRSGVYALRESLPVGDLLYSLKANPNRAIVRAVAEEGCGAEVSSIRELDVALEAGMPPSRILLTGPGKTLSLLAAALDKGCDWISIESARECRLVDRLAAVRKRTIRVLIRINLPQTPNRARLAISGGSSKFGIDLAEALDARRLTFGEHTTLEGFHFFQATNVWDPEALAGSARAAVDAARTLADRFGVPAVLNLGGGFPAPYATKREPPAFDLRTPIEAAIRRAFQDASNRPAVVFEAGRAIVARTGTLMCSVIDVKKSGGTTYVIVDSGIHHLGGMGGLRRVAPIEVDVLGLSPALDATSFEEQLTIAGPLCTPLDTWRVARGLHRIEPGEILAIPNVGAYGLTASLVAFLGHDAPIEVAVRGEAVIDVSVLQMSTSDVIGARRADGEASEPDPWLASDVRRAFRDAGRS